MQNFPAHQLICVSSAEKMKYKNLQVLADLIDFVQFHIWKLKSKALKWSRDKGLLMQYFDFPRLFPGEIPSCKVFVCVCVCVRGGGGC